MEMAMEEEKGSSAASARWNPTKEQIGLLEGLYRQGLRTPSADQIQQITGKLREFGPIEGKNVFYWFQNHKARQRQKQKQETFAYLNNLLHHHHRHPALPPDAALSPPVAFIRPPACNNVLYNPYCSPASQAGTAGYYQTHATNVLMPGAGKRKPTPELQMMEKMKDRTAASHNNTMYLPQGHHGNPPTINGAEVSQFSSCQTLQLFPLHPTGIPEEGCPSSVTSASMESETLEDGEEEVGGRTLPFYNFIGSA